MIGVLAAAHVIHEHSERHFRREGRPRPGAHHVVRGVAREGLSRELATIGDEQVVDEDHWSGGRGRHHHLRSGGGHGDRELLARAQARRDLDLDRLPIGGRELDHCPGRSTLWHLDRHLRHGAHGHDLRHGSLDSSRSGQ